MRPLAVLLALGLPAAALGWAVFHLLGGPGQVDRVRDLVWAVALAVAVLGVLAGCAAWAGRHLGDPVCGWAAATAVGWGIANAAGWSLAVEFGGPATGLVLGVAVAGATAGTGPARGAAIGLAGLVGVVGARLVVGEAPLVLGLLAAVVAGVGLVLAARALLAPRLPLLPIGALTAGFGVSWVLAWVVADRLLSPISVSVSIAVEILAAIAAGAAVLGWVQRDPVGEPIGRVVLRWVVVTGLAVIGSAVLAAVLAALGFGAGVVDLLDVGTTVGLAVTAWIAVRPTLRGLVERRAALRAA